MILQHIILPFVCFFWKVIYVAKKPHLIVFADAHHDTLPYSLTHMWDTLQNKGYKLTEFVCDYSKMSLLGSTLSAIKFMKLYAQAKYVFICDNFLPVSSCRKRKGTKVVQLWHSCGLLKKMGYDTSEDIPSYYLGNVYRNYDLVTVSSPHCISALCSGMKLSSDVVKSLGVSRTDNYFDQKWIDECRAEFYKEYPEALGKTIVLWAPTFRGNAGNPYLVGADDIDYLESQLGSDYYVIRKTHPYIERKTPISNCHISTERLLTVVDLLITDYSTILYDYLFFKKPFVLFAPDFDTYNSERGLYIEYESLTPYVCKSSSNLLETVKSALQDNNKEWMQRCFDLYLCSCDGNATERIWEYIKD